MLRTLVALIAWWCCTVGAPASAATDAGSHWERHGGDEAERRFSPLSQINDRTVQRLALDWFLDLPGENALEATPLEVSGTLYFSGGFGVVYAVDSASGKLLWRHDPEANRKVTSDTPRLYGVNRGVAYWNGLVYVATKDCRLIALDAKTGRPAWISSFLAPGTIATSSGAPRVFNGKVIIGNSGAERNARGYVTTFDAKTGKLLWRFFIVPGDPAQGFENDAMAAAAKTWSGEWWKYGGGGTPWNGITFDAELNQVYIGTGNAGPYHYKDRLVGRKDNLFVASVVALDADTGAYKWHYQYNPLEVWDWKATADIILADLSIAGVARKVLLQAPSNGFFYVIDRHNGKVISAAKLGKANWADRIDLATGRPVERDDIRYEKQAQVIYPSAIGAHNWQASSFSPRTGLVYIPYMQIGMRYWRTPAAEELVGDVRSGGLTGVGVNMDFHVDPADPMDGRGSLLAWDPVRQQLRWRVDHSSLWNAGTMVTAGNLVFQGTHTGKFFAYDASTGQQLWEFDAGLGILAPPISYAAGGKQRIALLVGYGGGGGEGSKYLDQGWKYGLQPRRLLSFALDGAAKLPTPPAPDFNVVVLDDPAVKLDPAEVKRGNVLYHLACTACHGTEAIATGGAPDLRASGIAFNEAALRTTLRNGPLVDRGMPRFTNLSDAQVHDIYAYIRSRARDTTTSGARTTSGESRQ